MDGPIFVIFLKYYLDIIGLQFLMKRKYNYISIIKGTRLKV